MSYLCPSLLQGDSKASPLALLAKTCSQIGADATPVSGTKASASAASSRSPHSGAGSTNGRSDDLHSGLSASSRASSSGGDAADDAVIRVSDGAHDRVRKAKAASPSGKQAQSG